MIIYEVWGDFDTGIGLVVSTAENIAYHVTTYDDENNLVPLYAFRARTWTEAMTLHYEHNGWGIYNPPI